MSPHSPDLNPVDFHLRGHEKEPPVPAAPVNSEKVFHHGIVDACKTILSYPDIFERMRWATMRPVEACFETHEGHFELLL